MRAFSMGFAFAALFLGGIASPTFGAGPFGPTFVSNYVDLASGTTSSLDLIQGDAGTTQPSAVPLAVPGADHGDFASPGGSVQNRNGRFDLAALLNAGAPYFNGPRGSRRLGGASDGAYNYRLDYTTGEVVRYGRHWDNPFPVFSVAADLPGAGWMAMNEDDGTFWLSQWGQADLVAHFSPTGKLLSSFHSGVIGSVGLVFDSNDATLWMADREKLLVPV